MRVATCLSGEARLLEEPCTTRAMFDRVIVPLKSEVFITLNVANSKDIPTSHAHIQNILVSYKPAPVVRLFNIDVLDEAVLSFTTKLCTEHDQLGRKQASGLVQCAMSIFAQQMSYDWVVRLRSDLYIPYIIHSLPPARHVGRRIIVDYVGHQCMRGVAPWTDDRMALLPLWTQRAYLLGYANDFCRRPTDYPGWRPAECKLGWTLATRNITPIGLGGTWRRRIRLLRPIANVCTTLHSDNHHPTHQWPNASEVLSENDILHLLE